MSGAGQTSAAQGVWEMCRAALGDEDGWIVVIRVYMDESGTHDESPVITVGAYMSRPKEWRDFTKEWNRLKRPIKVFHAADCANLAGEFNGWDKLERDKFVANLLPVLPKYRLLGLGVGINLKDFNEATCGDQKLRANLGSPYECCFQWAVQTIVTELEGSDTRERIAFFHEDNDYKDLAFKAFKWIKDRRVFYKEPMSLTFGGKEDFVPLQAADVLAYETNKRMRDFDRQERRAWKVLASTQRVRTLRYDKSNMKRLITGLC